MRATEASSERLISGKRTKLVSQALALDDASDIAHVAKSWVLMGAIATSKPSAEAERALSLNAGFIDAYHASFLLKSRQLDGCQEHW
jgi:hypothetical protein